MDPCAWTFSTVKACMLIADSSCFVACDMDGECVAQDGGEQCKEACKAPPEVSVRYDYVRRGYADSIDVHIDHECYSWRRASGNMACSIWTLGIAVFLCRHPLFHAVIL